MRHSLLVVDDNRALTAPMTEYFERAGFNVTVANSAAEAKDAVEDKRFSLVITDLRLEHGRDEDGLELIRFVRQNSPGMPVFVLTASGEPETASEGLRLNVDRYLGKPISLPKLLNTVQEFVGHFYGG